MPLPLFQKKSSQIKKTFAIAAGKGGVGKSFVAVTLARCLKRMGYKVGLFDADLYGPSICKMIPEESGPEYIKGRWKPALAEGMPILSMGHFKKESEGVVVRAPIAAKLINQFINEADWGELDLLLIDFPPGTGDIAIELAQKTKLDGVLLVTTPQEISIIDVRRAGKMFIDTGAEIIGIVENMSYFLDPSGLKHELFGKGGGAVLSREFGVPLLASLPLLPEAGKLADLGISLYLSHDKGLEELKSSFETISDEIIKWQMNEAGSQLRPRQIRPLDPYSFEIEWQDGKTQKFNLSTLLASCPCANCLGASNLQNSIRAKGISEVGRYAIKIDFETGCKNGIYPYNYLRTLGMT